MRNTSYIRVCAANTVWIWQPPSFPELFPGNEVVNMGGWAFFCDRSRRGRSFWSQLYVWYFWFSDDYSNCSMFKAKFLRNPSERFAVLFVEFLLTLMSIYLWPLQCLSEDLDFRYIGSSMILSLVHKIVIPDPKSVSLIAQHTRSSDPSVSWSHHCDPRFYLDPSSHIHTRYNPVLRQINGHKSVSHKRCSCVAHTRRELVPTTVPWCKLPIFVKKKT